MYPLMLKLDQFNIIWIEKGGGFKKYKKFFWIKKFITQYELFSVKNNNYGEFVEFFYFYLFIEEMKKFEIW